MKFNFKKFSKGFTLIELIVVIGIIGILAAAILVTLDPIEQFNKTKDTAKQTAARELINAVERYYATYQVYPWQAGALYGSATTLGGVNDPSVGSNGTANCNAAPSGTYVWSQGYSGGGVNGPFIVVPPGAPLAPVPNTTGTGTGGHGCLSKLVSSGEIKSVKVPDFAKSDGYLTWYVDPATSQSTVCYWPESKANKLKAVNNVNGTACTSSPTSRSCLVCFK